MGRFSRDAAGVLEIFRTYQGEGLYAGAPQVFVRFAVCHLRCSYCDTPESWGWADACDVDGRRVPNPVDRATLVDLVREQAARGPTHSLSLTGGEPLLQVDFLEAALPDLRAIRPVHVDTSGSLPDALARVVDLVETVALDVKLPSTPGARVPWDAIEASLALAARRDSFVKVVLLDEHPVEESEQAADRIARAAPRLPVFLQPATPVNARTKPPDPDALKRHLVAFARRGLAVRVLPQLHVVMGWK